MYILNRAIFRGKCDDNWVSGFYVGRTLKFLRVCSKVCHCILDDRGLLHKIDANTLCQFVRFTDIKLNSVFDHDILYVTESTHNVIYDKDNGKCLYDDNTTNQYYYYVDGSHGSHMNVQRFYDNSSITFVIVGNKFDNHDLYEFL